MTIVQRGTLPKGALRARPDDRAYKRASQLCWGGNYAVFEIIRGERRHNGPSNILQPIAFSHSWLMRDRYFCSFFLGFGAPAAELV